MKKKKREGHVGKMNMFVIIMKRRTMNGTEADEDEALRKPDSNRPLVNLGLIRSVLHILLRRNEVIVDQVKGCKSLTHGQSHKIIVPQIHGGDNTPITFFAETPLHHVLFRTYVAYSSIITNLPLPDPSTITLPRFACTLCSTCRINFFLVRRYSYTSS